MSLFAPRRPVPRIHAGDDLQASAPLRLDGVTSRALETGRTRLLAAAAMFLVAFTVIGLRMVDVAVFDRSPAKAAPIPEARDQTDIERADIVDRNGAILATSLPTVSLYARANEVQDDADAAHRLATVLPDLNLAETEERLSSRRPFVYLRRNLTPRQQYDVNALGVPGLYFEKGERRVYPHGDLTAHIVGMTDIDNKGVSGIERRFNDQLRADRQPLRLSIDIRMQTVVRDELSKTVREFDALGGVGVVMDVRTGEVLAMVSLPDFDPNDPPAATDSRMFNRATKGLYEMGSTFKLFDLSAALDSGIATPSSSYDATAPLQLDGMVIHDDHPQARWLTLPEILIYSSNIGAARIALQLGATNQRAFLGRVGLLAPTAIELPETSPPLVPRVWRDINTATIGFGHGISVTPLHLVTGVSALVNGGEFHPATLLARDPAAATLPDDRVVKAKTSEELRRMMRLVVTSGTGKYADVPGYFVGGKTGTAEKTANGVYEHKAVLSSFIAAFPIDAPRYCVLVMVDEPHGTKETYGLIAGGWTAAPAVARIIAQVAPLTGMTPRHDPPLPGSIVDGAGGRDVAANE